MTTVYAVSDMSEILKRLPELSSLLDSSSGRSEEGKIPKLKFMGLSYRTMVVQTLAILYPEHVSRMVLNGTGNAKDWVDKWQMGYLIDTDAIRANFYDDCFEAKEACPLWRAHDSASTDIENGMTNFLENLKQRPVYAIRNGNARSTTYRDIKLAMYWTTMAPDFAAPLL